MLLEMVYTMLADDERCYLLRSIPIVYVSVVEPLFPNNIDLYKRATQDVKDPM